jgi:hypothetical protein
MVAVALIPHSRGACIDLAPYASNPDYLNVLTVGGRVPVYAPAFFDIPAEFITGEVIYCLENITIPSFVGENECTDSQKCWLAVGLHATENGNDRSATESCVNSEGDTSGCYDCSCKSLSMGSGSPTEKAVSSGGCGLQTDSRWGVTCGDVTNGRYNWVGDEMVASNFSHVQVSICPENQSHCSLCQGGLHPSFRVAIQWIMDLEEQCVNDPFGFYSCSQGLQITSLIGVIAGSVFLFGALLSFYFFVARRKRALPKASSKSSIQLSNDSPPIEKLSFRTETSNP